MPALATPSYSEIVGEAAARGAVSRSSILYAAVEVYVKRNWPRSRAMKEAASRMKTIQNEIDEHVQSFEARGLVRYYQRDHTNPRFVVPNRDAGRYKFTARVRDQLAKLDPRAFEILVGNTLRRSEFDAVAVTRQSGDAGVDFVGRKALAHSQIRRMEVPSFLGRRSIFAFGQVKRYKLASPLGPPTFHELVGSFYSLERRQGGTQTIQQVRNSLVQWGWEHDTPTFLCLATSGVFSSPTRSFLFERGGAGLDGEQLAQRILASAPTIGSVSAIDQFVKRESTRKLAGVTLLELPAQHELVVESADDRI
jgi:hypothetical protein